MSSKTNMRGGKGGGQEGEIIIKGKSDSALKLGLNQDRTASSTHPNVIKNNFPS